jgi:pimeloyl-ACP methyl ester carboxylesterase
MTQLTHRFVETNGIRMHLAEQGTGPLFLLLHGFPEGWYSWRHQMAALSEAGYHAVAPDQRGYGETGHPASPERYTRLHLVGDVIGLLDAVGSQTVVIAGHDWGAGPAWSTALLRPERVRAVIALGLPYSPRGPISPLRAARTALGEGFYQNYFQKPGVAEAEFERDVRTTLRKILYASSGDATDEERASLVIPEGEGWLDRTADPEVLPAWLTEKDITHYATEFERTGFTGALNWYRAIDKSWELMAPWHLTGIVSPALFLVGERDPVRAQLNWQEQIATMSRFVPNLKATTLIQGAGHWVQQERPEEVNTEMLAFLRDL